MHEVVIRVRVLLWSVGADLSKSEAGILCFWKIKFLNIFELTTMGDDCNIDLSEELEFHGIEYIISVSVSDGPVLVIDVEQVVNTHIFASFSGTEVRLFSER